MMIVLFDNRASLTGEPDDSLPLFYPPQSSPTVVPRSLAPVGPPKFPGPGTPEWGHLNRRRAELIRQKVRGGLSQAEEEELEWLQRETLAGVDRTFPRPRADMRSVAELEERLKGGPGPETP